LAQLGVTAGRIVGTRGPLDVVVAPVQLSQLVIKGPARARLVRMQYISLRQSGGQSRPRSIGYLEAVTPLFDEHSRLLPPPPLADSTGPSGPLSFLPALSSRAYLPIQYFSPGFDRR